MIGASVSLEDGTGGAKITEQGASGSAAVTSGGPADKAGLKPGDVITKLDDQVIDSGPTLIGEIWTHQPGDVVKLTYTRDGKTHGRGHPRTARRRQLTGWSRPQARIAPTPQVIDVLVRRVPLTEGHPICIRSVSP